MKNNEKASAPRGAADATPVRATAGQPAVPWWVSLRQGLQLASQLVVASPVRLPSKVVTAAKYVSLALGLWESFDLQPDAPPGVAAKEDGEAEAPDAP
ncbi:hypothetical protein SAMN05660226_02349 [Parapedobacter luteus]|uniref:Uncharacterized protein n=1 Tax=Parapedobacter luteus TaxID=623280 RepID=A0A1T5CUG0_9SPHI|nr:hypothetical protein SAMN05660226_02349 [Parapedobacter luteus]